MSNHEKAFYNLLLLLTVAKTTHCFEITETLVAEIKASMEQYRALEKSQRICGNTPEGQQQLSKLSTQIISPTWQLESFKQMFNTTFWSMKDIEDLDCPLGIETV